jgi:hypothetical protein
VTFSILRFSSFFSKRVLEKLSEKLFITSFRDRREAGLPIAVLLHASKQDAAYYQTNYGNKCDIFDQHILFYRSTETINGTKAKKFLEYRTDRCCSHKKLNYHEGQNKVVKNYQNSSGYKN